MISTDLIPHPYHLIQVKFLILVFITKVCIQEILIYIVLDMKQQALTEFCLGVA